MTEPVTLISGTRKGIGRFLVDHYRERGNRVYGFSRGSLGAEVAGYTHFQADVNDEKAVKQIFSAIRRREGRLDHLINNAGIASMNHCMMTPMTTVNSVLATNVAGTFLLCREAARLLRKSSRARIVNFTSVAVPLRLEGEAIYAASKAAVEMLTKVLARELGPLGITVNSIGPTPVETDLIASVPAEKIDSLVKRQAIRRLGTFQDVAQVIDFFLDEKSDFVTGQNLYLGGIG